VVDTEMVMVKERPDFHLDVVDSVRQLEFKSDRLTEGVRPSSREI